ncbi:MAG: hypothetical protein KFB93_03350 [Simkaniaceae bacterium]|nr:MAG: hypothetical protein KFB93_03350 [Simkaniaceae bacterium]
MTTGSNPIAELIKQQTQQGSSSDEKALSSAFEVALKVIFWFIDQIPYINTWFINHFENSIPATATKVFNDRELIQLSAYPCPSYFTARQVAHVQNKIALDYRALIARDAEAPEYSICYSVLGVVSEDLNCIGDLTQKVTQFYQAKGHSIHLGKPHHEKRPFLSPNFIRVCVTILPPLLLTELYIHGPIASKDDRERLKTIITTTNTLATVHLEVEKVSATYFTSEADGMLGVNHTITVFNLTLMGKRSPLTFDTDPWGPLNAHARCTLTYTNVKAPDGFVPNRLTFQ